jgi:hypothetical protein
MQIYIGKNAKRKCTHILNNYQDNLTERCLGMWLDNNVYILES